ncbi:hypothetical protein BJ912DRAFT_982875 [Pholiota molesta]|nr:hypothetical protein BJ912DRAFT_982875 [Pholiota molesta]
MHVPTEVVDNIINKVFYSSGTVHRPTPSALALVSHTFRHRTNFHRFSKVSFMHKIEPIWSIHDFLALLTSDVWTPHAGVARHIREFSLALVLSTYASSGYPRSFDDSNQRNSWEDLIDPHFGPILQRLLDSHVSKLEISGLNNLPPTLLAGTRIRKLTLRKARFRLHSASKYSMLGQTYLKELGIDGASEFMHGPDQLSPTLGFAVHLSVLETLTFDITVSVSTVESLRSRFSEVIVAVNMSLEKHRVTSSGFFVVGQILAALSPHLPLTSDLELSFRIETIMQASRASIAAIFGHFSFTTIDQGLGSLLALYGTSTLASTPPIITVKFSVYIESAWEIRGFDAQAFCEAGYLFLEQSFPLINNHPGRKKFDNKISKILMQDGKYDYDITVFLVYCYQI